MRLHGIPDDHQLLHQLFIDMKTAGGIDDQNIKSFIFSFFRSLLCDNLRMLFLPVRIDRHADLFRHNLQLIDSGRPIDVTGRQHRLLSVFHEIGGQFTRCRRLTGTLQTHQHDNGKSFRRIRQLAVCTSHDSCQLFIHDFDDLLSRRQALQNICTETFFLDARHKVFHDLEVYVCLQESQLHLAHGVVYVGFRDDAFSFQFLKDTLQFFRKAFKCHGTPPRCLAARQSPIRSRIFLTA